MGLHVTVGKRGRFAKDVYRQLFDAVRDGRLRPGDQLPATRRLADSLAVSRNTVLDAYQRLVAEGFLVGRAGAGTFVSSDAASVVRVASSASGAVPKRSRPKPAAIAAVGMWRDADVSPSLAPAAFDFRIGIPD